MKKRFLYVIVPSVLWLILSAVPDSASAQGYQSFRRQFALIEESTRYQMGPFRIFPSIMFSDIGYDNNVYRLPDDTEPIGDITFTSALPVTTHLLMRDRMIITFNFTPEYIYFAKESRERSFNYSYSPAVRWLLFSRLVLSGNYFYRKARRRATSEFDLRVMEEQKEVRGQLFYETGRRTTIGFTGIYREVKYEDVAEPGLETGYSIRLDHAERIAQGDLYYQIWTDSQFFVNAGFGDVAFAHPETMWKDSYTYYIYPGIHFPLLGRIQGTLSIGYKILDPYRAKKKGFAGFVGNTRIEYSLGRFMFRGLYERDTQFSFWTDNVFFIEDRYSLGVSYYMNQYIRLNYDFSYRDAYYPESQRLRLPDETYQDINRSDQYTSHRAGIVIRIFRSAGIGIRITYWERASNVREWDRKQTIIGGYLTYEF